MHHPCCSSEKTQPPSDVLHLQQPGQGTSYGQWFGPQDFPKAGNAGVWAGPVMMAGPHQLSPARGLGHHLRLQAHLKTARWVCSCSSPLIMQENNPKDSAPGDKSRGGRLSVEESAPQARQGQGLGRLLRLLGDGLAEMKPHGTTGKEGMARAAALVPTCPHWDHDLPAPTHAAVTVTSTVELAMPWEALPGGACHQPQYFFRLG